MKKSSSPSPLVPTLAILAVVGAVGGGYAWMKSGNFLSKEDSEVTQEVKITQEEWKREGDAYTITWEHPTSPGKTGKIGFAVELAGDKITSADILILTTNEESKQYQEDFQGELAQAVVGKKISELTDIDIIGGASSTTENFKEAVAALGEQLSI